MGFRGCRFGHCGHYDFSMAEFRGSENESSSCVRIPPEVPVDIDDFRRRIFDLCTHIPDLRTHILDLRRYIVDFRQCIVDFHTHIPDLRTHPPECLSASTIIISNLRLQPVPGTTLWEIGRIPPYRLRTSYTAYNAVHKADEKSPNMNNPPSAAQDAIAMTAYEQIDARLLSKHQKSLVGLVIVGNIVEFFDMFLIGFVVSLLTYAWNLTGVQTGVILACSGLGTVIGSIMWGALSDAFGRKRAFQ